MCECVNLCVMCVFVRPAERFIEGSLSDVVDLNVSLKS
jgi:hypothetical protein